MKKIVIALLATVSGVVLLFSYRTSTEAVAPTALGGSGAPSAAPPVASTGLVDGSYRGQSASTRWGPVQVQITVRAGKVTSVEATDYPTQNGRDRQINGYAIPLLAKEALAAQSAKIDMVSGATITSRGYISSLQSALDQANG